MFRRKPKRMTAHGWERRAAKSDRGWVWAERISRAVLVVIVMIVLWPILEELAHRAGMGG